MILFMALARCASEKSAAVDARPARSTARRWVGSETETSSEEPAPHRTAETRAFAVLLATTGRATAIRAETDARAIV